MPEEVNRVLTDHIADILFCPTSTAVENLRAEGIRPKAGHGLRSRLVVNSGDVMYDALLVYAKRAADHSSILSSLGLTPQGFCLATIHRQSNTDDPNVLAGLLDALGRISEPVIFPVHPRTAARIEHFGFPVAGHVKMIAPVGYLDMIQLEQSARVIVTDSGGVQKEAFLLRVPCVTLRDETEWVETVSSGWNVLAGTDAAGIAAAVTRSVAPATRPDPYGDGRAAETIMATLVALLGDE
jgi:UDP-N-acetylglucosamine 2-epimerase